ncbi:hypothetical protein FI667_g8718, partial [Globisporangium splendens]
MGRESITVASVRSFSNLLGRRHWCHRPPLVFPPVVPRSKKTKMPSSSTALSSSGIKITHRSSAPVLVAQSHLFCHQVHVSAFGFYLDAPDMCLTLDVNMQDDRTPQDDGNMPATAAPKATISTSAIQPTIRASFLFSSSRRKARRTSSAVEVQACRRRCVNAPPRSAMQTPAAVTHGEPEKSRWLQRIEKGVVKFITTFCR